MVDYGREYCGLTMTSPIGDVMRVLREFFAEEHATTLVEAKAALTYKAAFDDEVFDSIADAGWDFDRVLTLCLARADVTDEGVLP
ncbi:hypothetical protein EG835_04495 [bacterium]|nr:hypothetical protein [bacterium]